MIEINDFYIKVKKNYNCKMENDGFYPVIDTFYFLHIYTQVTDYSIDLLNRFENYHENIDYMSPKTQSVLNFIKENIDEKDDIKESKTELTSNSLTENISYIPFTYMKKPFIATWLSNRFPNDAEQIGFLQLRTPINHFVDSTHKIWYIHPKMKRKHLFIDYAKDITYASSLIFAKDGFYDKHLNKKIVFVF